MKNFIQKTFILSLALGVLFPSSPAFALTANDQSSYVPYTGAYAFGTNMGYYGQHFKDQDIAQLSYNAGARTIRPSLPDWLITGYGVDVRTDAFKTYISMGMKDLTVFLGEPNQGGYGTPNNRETRVFPGADEAAWTFKGMYEPIWLDSAKTQINPANTYANYVYKTVKEYGPYVKFWEIVNEPDLSGSAGAWEEATHPESWFKVNPQPKDLQNLKAPVFYYIREMRVAYDVIKTLEPNDYVTTGGLGFPSFLDVILRNTDNPVDGSVTAEYPLKGGAYFDVLSFHSYPMYSLRTWDNGIFGFIYKRHSDAAIDVFLDQKNQFDTILKKYGYGTIYPAKQWIMTELDIPGKTVGDIWGSQESSNNFIVKAAVMAQANNIRQMYKYGMGQNEATNDIFNTMGLYGDLTPSSTTIANAPRTEQFKVFQTESTLLYGKTYDANRTAQLSLPPSARGAAFRDASGLYTYVLWAKTSVDKSEIASAPYTFPFAFTGVRRETDYSVTNQSVNASQSVTLTGAPSFFIETSGSGGGTTPPDTGYYPPYIPPQPTYIPNNISPTVNAGVDKTIVITTTPAVSVLLLGTANDPDGGITQYAWRQVGGPSTVSFDTPQNISTIARNLVSGSYQFVLTVTDTRGASATDDVRVSVIGSVSTSTGRVMTIATRLNVRNRANGTIITRVPYGTRGLATEQATAGGLLWKKVKFDSGLTGWVAAQYLKAN